MYYRYVKWDHSFDVGWDKKGIAADHALKLSLDLSFEDLVGSKNVAAEIALHEQDIRNRICKNVAEHLIPQIIRNSRDDGTLPEGKIATNTQLKMRSEWAIQKPKVKGEAVGIRSRMAILFNIHANRPVNAMQALNASAGGLALAITDDIIFSLKKKYLGVTEHRTTSKITLTGGKLVDSTARSQTDVQAN